jgi:hypothetical protein
VELLTRQSVGLDKGAMVSFDVTIVDLQKRLCVICQRRSRLLFRLRWGSADLIKIPIDNAKSVCAREIGSAPEVWVTKFVDASS